MTDPTVPGEPTMTRRPRLRWLVISVFVVAMLGVAAGMAVWGSHWSSHVYDGTHSHGNPSASVPRI